LQHRPFDLILDQFQASMKADKYFPRGSIGRLIAYASALGGVTPNLIQFIQIHGRLSFIADYSRFKVAWP
jgi:hypothetical protein